MLVSDLSASSTEAASRDELYALLDDEGGVRAGLTPPVITDEQGKALYRGLLQVRIIDHRMLQMQREGRIGFYLTSAGEEATHFGGAFPLRASDWIFPSYREPGVAFWRGYSLTDWVNQLFGNAQDPIKGRQMPVHHSMRAIHCVSISSPVGTQISQATGMAMAAKISSRDDVALVYFGEGATSTGEFHVGMNFAGVWKAPVIFLCRNDGRAISTTSAQQTAASSYAMKGIGYGVRAIRVDGNDLLAMISAVELAAARARRGEGATLIEAVTERIADASIDPAAWTSNDPLERWRRYLDRRGLWSQALHDELVRAIEADISAAVDRAEKIPAPALSTMFDDVYAELTPKLVEQRDQLANAPRAKPLPGHS